MTLTVMYYRREEHPLVISWWYCQQGVQLCVAGLLAFGLTYITDAPIYPWQALFIVVGGLTVIWGVLILVFLPDSPMRAKVS
jgi:sugar phosphate permease